MASDPKSSTHGVQDLVPPTSQALTKRENPETGLISAPPPQPPVKRIKRAATVLEEDTYEAGLDHIIRRDFFPGLAESDAKTEYMAALDSGDVGWIAEAGQALKQVTRPGLEGRNIRDRVMGIGSTPVSRLQTPGVYEERAGDTPRGWQGETPNVRASEGRTGDEGQDKNGNKVPGKEADTTLSLSEFQRKYTSEDNESFYKLLDRSNQSRASKHAHLWSGTNKIPSSRQIEESRHEQGLIAARAAETAVNGRELARIELPDDRPAAPDTWRAKPNNTFMFAPEGVEDELGSEQRRREEQSRMGEKRVVHENTRMPPPPLRTRKGEDAVASAAASPSLSAVRDAIRGRPRLGTSELGSTVGSGAETPRVNGWAFVDSEEPEPEPEPTSSFSRDQELDLGPGDATPNPFNIRETRGREALHLRMVDRINRNRESKRIENVKTPMSRSIAASSPRIAREGMSPAAQRLLGQVGNTSRSRLGVGANSVGGGTPKKSSLGDAWGDGAGTPRSRPSLAGVTPLNRK